MTLQRAARREAGLAEKRRQCEARPGGHDEVPAGVTRLGNKKYEVIGCRDCDAQRVVDEEVRL